MKTIPRKTGKGCVRRMPRSGCSVCHDKTIRWICLSDQEAKQAAKILLTPFVPNEAAQDAARRWADIPQLG